MLASLIFYSLLFFVLLVVPAGLILLVLFFLDHERQLWHRVAPVIVPIGLRMARYPAVVFLGNRYPRVARFLAARLDPQDARGLPATLTVIVMILGLWVFLGVVQDLMARDPLVVLDIRIHNAIPLFRSNHMTTFMLFVTELGSTTVLTLLCSGAALLALAKGKRRLAVVFVLALLAPGLISTSLKALIGNARPLDAIIRAHEASFPSGHMLSGTVLYGLLAALLLASGARRSVRAIGVALLLVVMVGIGLSRLYLGVHWPSDVLGSLALALSILAGLSFFLHHVTSIRWVDTFALPTNTHAVRIAGGTALLTAMMATALLANREELLLITPPLATRAMAASALLVSFPADLPRWSEDLIGGRMEPVSLVLVGSEAELAGAFARGGWARADPPTPVRVLQEGIAAIRNAPDPTAPATPAFLLDQPQALTFEKPDAADPGIRRRHHTRVWQTSSCLLPDCRCIWLATASFDAGLEISPRLHLPTHRIDLIVDDERAFIVESLVQAGALRMATIPVSPPVHGNNAAGDPFRTDGQAVVLSMPCVTC